jgi:hypothetical protein
MLACLLAAVGSNRGSQDLTVSFSVLSTGTGHPEVVKKVNQLRSNPTPFVKQLKSNSATDSFQGTTSASVTVPKVTQPGSSSRSVDAGPVAGGVVGGLLLVGLIGGAVFASQRNKQPKGDVLVNDSQGDVEMHANSMHGGDAKPPMGQAAWAGAAPPTYEQPMPMYEQAGPGMQGEPVYDQPMQGQPVYDQAAGYPAQNDNAQFAFPPADDSHA